MNKNIIYKCGCVIGIFLLILKFIVYIEKVDFFALGYLILGTVFLMNYYFDNGYKDQIHFWWQNVAGFCFLFFFIYYQFDLHNKLELPLTLIVFIFIGVKYAFLRFKKEQPKCS